MGMILDKIFGGFVVEVRRESFYIHSQEKNKMFVYGDYGSGMVEFGVEDIPALRRVLDAVEQHKARPTEGDLRIYYWEADRGHGSFRAAHDSEAVRMRPVNAIVVYRESDTLTGEPFVVLWEQTPKEPHTSLESAS